MIRILTKFTPTRQYPRVLQKPIFTRPVFAAIIEDKITLTSKSVAKAHHEYWGEIAGDTALKIKQYYQFLPSKKVNSSEIQPTANLKIAKRPVNEHRSAFIKDNSYRQTLAQQLQVAPKKLQSVMGINEFKFLLKNKFKTENFMPGLNDINVKNGNYTANLHIHTINSDGEFDAKTLLDTAKKHSDKIGKTVYFSTTDHNNIQANNQILELLAKDPKKYKKIKFIPGVEIRNQQPDENGKILSYETLAYGINPYKKGYETFLPQQKSYRTSKEVADFYKDENVLLCLAHPQRSTFDNLKNFIEDVFMKNDGHALEGYYSYTETRTEKWAKNIKLKSDEDMTSEIKTYAKEFGLLLTGGRDCHELNFFHRRGD